MAIRLIITVKESKEALRALLGKASAHQRPRIKMLLKIAHGETGSAALAAATGATPDSISNWKKKIRQEVLKRCSPMLGAGTSAPD